VLEDDLLRLGCLCPRCAQPNCAHLRGAAFSVETLRERRRDRTPVAPSAELDREEAELKLTSSITLTTGKTYREVMAGREASAPAAERPAHTTGGPAEGDGLIRHTIRCVGRRLDSEVEEDGAIRESSDYDSPGLLADWGGTVRGPHPNAPAVRLIGVAVPVGYGAIDAHYAVDAPDLPRHPLSVRDVAGSDDGSVATLAPIVEREIARQICFVPRLTGEREDLWQGSMAVAIEEARKLSPCPGESLDEFAARLERRVAVAVRHRLIDAIRRQDAADRHLPGAELREDRLPDGSDDDLSGEEEEMFCLLFRPRPDEDTALVRYVLAHASGFARKVVEAVLG
jgi:hypothetical protein